MAHRTVYPTRTGRYGTRMLTAGEPIEVSGPLAREMIALGRATEVKPTKARPLPEVRPHVRPSTRLHPADPPEQDEQDEQEETESDVADAPVDDLAAARSEYVAALGHPPHHSWDVAKIRAKIAERGAQ